MVIAIATKELRALTAVLVVGLFATSCALVRPWPSTVKIGLVVPFSGRYWAVGAEALIGTKLAIAEWNQRGGVAGYSIELVAQDDRSNTKFGSLQARKMIIDPQVMVVIGHLLETSNGAVAEEYHKARLAMLGLGVVGAKDKARAYPAVRWLSPSREDIAQAAADFIGRRLGLQRIGLLWDDNPYDKALAEALHRELALKGRQPVLIGAIPQGQGARGEFILDLLQEAPDLVFYTGPFWQAASLWKEARSSGLGAEFLGGPTVAFVDLVTMGGSVMQGSYYMTVSPDPGPLKEAKDFVEAYRANTGRAPTWVATLAYDATNLALQALEQAIETSGRPERAAVVRALSDMGDYQGITGTMGLNDSKVARAVYFYRIDASGFPGVLQAIESPKH